MSKQKKPEDEPSRDEGGGETAKETQKLDTRIVKGWLHLEAAYFLVKESTLAIKFPGLIRSFERTARKLGAKRKAATTKRGEHTVREMCKDTKDILFEEFLKELEDSPVIGAGLDESTDVEFKERAAIYVYYVKNGELKCKFLELVHIKSAKAVDITGAFKGVLKKAGLLHKLICFGSDGANVMLGTGDGGGVAKRLREDNDVWSCLISLHCICHRLALAANEAADDVDHFQYIDKLLRGAYNLMAHSAKRKLKFADIQKVNKESGVILRCNETRRLGRRDAIRSIINSLVSLLDFIDELYQMTPDARAAELGCSEAELVADPNPDQGGASRLRPSQRVL